MQVDTISNMAGSISSITKDSDNQYGVNAKSAPKTAQFEETLKKVSEETSQTYENQNNLKTDSTSHDSDGSSVKKSKNDNDKDSSKVKSNTKSDSKDKSKIKNNMKDNLKVKDNSEDEDTHDTSEDKKKIDDLLNMLFQILNLNGSTQDLDKLDQYLKSSADKLSDLKEICKELNIGSDTLIDMLKSSIENANAVQKSSTSDADILKSILNYSSTVLNPSDVKDNRQNRMLSKIKNMINSLINSSNQNADVKQDLKNGAMNDSKGENTGEAQTNDSSILEKLTGNIDSKMDKVTNFMSMLKASDAENTNVLPESITVNKATLPNDIIKAVKYMENNSIKNLTVKIQPKELGELYIKVTMENGELKAAISASSKDAYNVLNSNFLDIQNKLNDSGIKIQNFTLNAYEDPTYFSNDSGRENHESESGSKNKRSAESFNGIEAADDDKNYAKLSNNINLFA